MASTDFWDAFEVIRRVLGEPNYRASIREIFEAADEKDPPELYKEIWELQGVTSLLTLNIDGFAARAHRRTRPTEDIASFSGRDAGDYLGLIRRRKAGRSCSIQGRLKTNSIVVKFNNQQVEATKWSGLVKRWHEKMETAKEILASGGWTVLDTSHYAWHEILLEAEISIPKLKSSFARACKSLERGLDQVRLD